MATIRSTFDLNSRPASSALRDLRAQADETGSAMERVGRSLDSGGGTKQREQVRRYQLGLRLIGGDFEGSATRATALERGDLDSLAAQVGEIKSLESRVGDLGSASSFSIGSRGIPESLAEIEVLKRRIDALGRSSPKPSVGLGGITPPLAREGAAIARGSDLNVPLAGRLPVSTIAAGLGAAPPLLGAGTAVLGSAGSAALGAGAISVAGYGALAVGVGSIAAVAVPAVASLRTSYQALTRYNAAVAQNGRNSTQADSALAHLKATLEGAPAGTRKALNREQAISSRFRSLTRPAQGSVIGALSNLLGAGNELEPEIAGVANPLLASVQRQSGRFGRFLTGPTTRGFLGAAGASAIEATPDAETAAQSILATLMNISRTSMPFLKTAVEWLERWTAGWRKSTGDIDGTRRSIGGMVRELKGWIRLGGAAFDLVRDLLVAGERPGGSLVAHFTEQERRWDAWVKEHPREVRAFFGEAADDVRKFATAAAQIVGLLFRVGRLASPLLADTADLVTLLGKVGLLSPAGAPLLRAGVGAIGDLFVGARGRVAGGRATAGSPAVVEGLVLSGGLGKVERPGLITRARGFFSGIRDAGRVPVVGGTLAAEADAGMIGATRFSTAAAARAGGTALLSGAGSLGSGFLRFAAEDYLPLAAVSAGLTAASFPGTLKARLEAGVSNLTFGLAPMPKTTAEKLDDAIHHAEEVSAYYGHRYGSGLTGLRHQILATRRKRHRLLQPVEGEGGFSLSLTAPSSFGDFLANGLNLQTRAAGVSDETRFEAEALGEQLHALRAETSSLATNRAEALGAELARAFKIRRRGGGLVGALTAISPDLLGRLEHLGPTGARLLSANVLGWANAAKRENAKLGPVYDELVADITARFAAMGHRIKVINGAIYTGTRREWNAIYARLADPIEQAREDVSNDFTAIQRQAVNSLRAMGYSPTQARRIVVSEEQGQPTKALAAEAVSRHHHGQSVATANNVATRPRGARGMRIPGAASTRAGALPPAASRLTAPLLSIPAARTTAVIGRPAARVAGEGTRAFSRLVAPTGRRLSLAGLPTSNTTRPLAPGVEPSRARILSATAARAFGGVVPSPTGVARHSPTSRAAMLHHFGLALGARLAGSAGNATAGAPVAQEVRIEAHRSRQLPAASSREGDERPLELRIPGDIIIGSDDDIRQLAERAGRTVEAAIRGDDPATRRD